MYSFFKSDSTFHSVYISTFFHIFTPLIKNASTFHSVYISTSKNASKRRYEKSLHSTLFILVLSGLSVSIRSVPALHSTLFILVQKRKRKTFHYNPSLHSTLFILVLIVSTGFLSQLLSTFHSVYISTRQRPHPAPPSNLYIPLCLY